MVVDAILVISVLKVRGNRVYGIVKEGDVIVRIVEDIIKIVGDKLFLKIKFVNAFVLVSVYVFNSFYVFVLSLVKEGEILEIVVYWYKEVVRMGLNNNIYIIGIGVDGDLKFRKFFLDKYVKGKD